MNDQALEYLKGQLKAQAHTTEFFKSTFFFCGAQLWNRPSVSDIRAIRSFINLKKDISRQIYVLVWRTLTLHTCKPIFRFLYLNLLIS